MRRLPGRRRPAAVCGALPPGRRPLRPDGEYRRVLRQHSAAVRDTCAGDALADLDRSLEIAPFYEWARTLRDTVVRHRDG